MITKIENEQELVKILKEAVEIHKQTHWAPYVLDLHRIIQYLEAAEKQPDRFFFIYDMDQDGKIKGLFLGMMSIHPLVQIKQANDLTFYVAPEHRRSNLFREMLDEFEKWARDNGATQVALHHNTGIEMESAPALYSKLGYEKSGYIFNKDL